MPERLPQIIDRLEQDGPIDPRSVDFTIENPALVRQLFEPAFTFSQVVETEVATSTEIVRTALPNMTMVLDRFLSIWKPQELAHGEVLGEQMDVLDIPREAPRQEVRWPIQLAGRLARVSHGVHDAIEVAYLVYAGLGEKETTKFYPKWSHQARDIGEIPLAQTLNRMAGQEGGHLGFYIAATREKRGYLKPWQMELVRRFIIHSYMPVGTHKSKGDSERQQHFGHMAFTMGGGDVKEFTNSIETLAKELLDISGELKPFVRRRYEECIEEYQASMAA